MLLCVTNSVQLLACFCCGFCLDGESKDDRVSALTEDFLSQAKVPVFPRDNINSKKAQAMQKDKTRQQSKLRTMGHIKYSPFAMDKHQSAIVRLFKAWYQWNSTNVMYLLCYPLLYSSATGKIETGQTYFSHHAQAFQSLFCIQRVHVQKRCKMFHKWQRSFSNHRDVDI